MIQDYKSLIVDIVNNLACVRSWELELKIMGLDPMTWNKESYNDTINELVETKEIVYIHYTTNEGTKVLYFPKGTIFHFSQV